MPVFYFELPILRSDETHWTEWTECESASVCISVDCPLIPWRHQLTGGGTGAKDANNPTTSYVPFKTGSAVRLSGSRILVSVVAIAGLAMMYPGV